MRYLILDRDGVINEESADFIKSPDEWHPISGSLEAIARACRAGYRIVVASNQSGLSRGIFDIEMLNRIHAEMHKRVGAAGGAIEAVFFCPHAPDEGCQCRKPQPGLLIELARRLRISLENVPVIGDRLSDIIAAQRAGAKPILVKTGRGDETARDHPALGGVAIYTDLSAFIDELTH